MRFHVTKRNQGANGIAHSAKRKARRAKRKARGESKKKKLQNSSVLVSVEIISNPISYGSNIQTPFVQS
jgi:hypothetical protein